MWVAAPDVFQASRGPFDAPEFGLVAGTQLAAGAALPQSRGCSSTLRIRCDLGKACQSHWGTLLAATPLSATLTLSHFTVVWVSKSMYIGSFRIKLP